VLQRWRKTKTNYKKKNYAGFLLIQIGVVLALFVLIITLSLSHSNLLRKQIMHAEVEKLAVLFRYFQQRACVTQREQKLVFDERTGSYVCDTYKQTLPFGIQFGCIAHSYGPPSNPQTLIKKGITFKNNTVVFSPDGSISAGTVYLVDAQKKLMYALTSPISHISFLRMYRYDSGWSCLS